MAKKMYIVKPESVDDYNFQDNLLYIEKTGSKVMTDMMITCKSLKTAYRRFYKAMEQAASAEQFGSYDIVGDALGITPEDFDEEWNNPFMSETQNDLRGLWKDIGFVLCAESVDEGLWYLYLNVSNERMAS